MPGSGSIHWLPWGERAFALAAAEQRPILLRVGAAWCKSCRMMEVEADADPVVAACVAEQFVPVYVDSDRQPDVGERYALGGWPTNAFLTPRGDLITGGTYFDVDTFRLLLSRVAQSWNERRPEVEEAVAARRRDVEAKRRPRPAADLPTIDSVEAIVDLTMDEFDFRYGGFGREPKFAHPASIELLLVEYGRTAEARLRDAALITLEAMWSPDAGRPRLADAGGGFFRYAARRDWSEPRHEKMLVDNAQLLSVYLSAHQLTGETRWAAAARSIVAYAGASLADRRRRIFRASQAAFPGKEYYGLDLPSRARMTPPRVDQTAYVGWNAQMASAFIKAGLVLGDDAVLEFGAAVVDNLIASGRAREDEILLGHVLDGRKSASGPVLLSSQVYTARALVDAYEALGGPARLTAAASILDEVHARLRDAVRQAYTDTIVEVGAEGYLSQPLVPLAENSAAADTLLRLAALLEAPAYATRALSLLKAISGYAPEYGFLAAPFGLALLRSLVRETMAVFVAATEDRRGTRQLVRAVNALYAPFKVVRFLEPERDRRRLRAIAKTVESGPAAVICRGPACAEPTGDTERLLAIAARAASASFPPVR